MDFLSILNIMVNIGDYPLSWVEFIGTLAGLFCVYWATKEKVWTWPIGLVNSLAFMAIFYQVNLYSDFFLQIFFFFSGLYGWFRWKNPDKLDKVNKDKELGVTSLSRKDFRLIFDCHVLLALLLGMLMSNIHTILPKYFEEPAAYPYVDSWIAVASVFATVLLTKKKLEAWYFWIAIDVVAIYVYYQKDILFVAGEYVVFLILAITGLLNWRKVNEQK